MAKTAKKKKGKKKKKERRPKKKKKKVGRSVRACVNLVGQKYVPAALWAGSTHWQHMRAN